MKKIELTTVAPDFILGKRLDQALVQLFKQYSRSYLKKLILVNRVVVNKHIINQPDKKIFGGEIVTIYPINQDDIIHPPENIFLNIVYEDDVILVINKPSGLVVHPGVGHESGTILNALLYRYKNTSNILPRAGIIHRLDKNTSGLMVIAKTIFSYYYLIQQLKKRKIVRKYQGIVKGNMISGGTIDYPIMRHRTKWKSMVAHPLGKKSITHYKIIKRFKFHTHISICIETGRTHQIRVHMLYIKHPLVGDSLYRGINYSINYTQDNNFNKIYHFPRQALHADHISLYHPITRCLMSWTIPIPKDMKELLLYL